MINNGDHNFLSNQVLGGLPAPQGNLGGDGAGTFTGNLAGIDFTTFAGNQFVSFVVPGRLPGCALQMTPAGGGLPSNVTLDYTFESLGFGMVETLTGLSVDDDLAAVFGVHGVDWTFVSISSMPAAFANAAFDGHSNTQLVNQAPSQSLAAGAIASVSVTIQLLTVDAAVGGQFCNDYTLAAVSPAVLTLSDTSNDGTDPDPNGDAFPYEMGLSCFNSTSVPVVLQRFDLE